MRKLSNRFANLSTKGKILFLSIVLCLFMIGVGLFSLYFLNSVKTTYDSVLDGIKERQRLTIQCKSDQNVVMQKFYKMVSYAMAYNDEATTKKVYDEIGEELEGMFNNIDAYNENLETDPHILPEWKEKISALVDQFEGIAYKFEDAKESGYENCLKDDVSAMEDVLKFCDELDAEGDEYLNGLLEISDVRTKDAVEMINVSVSGSIIGILVCIIAGIVIGILLTMAISKSITDLIKKVSDASKKIAEGDFNVDVKTNLTNEMGQLLHNFDSMLESFVGISDDLTKSIEEMNAGDLDTRIDDSKYMGLYRELALQVNSLLQNTGDELNDIMESISQYSSGNFAYEVPIFPGKKARLHESLLDMKDKLNNITDSVGSIIQSINDGNFDTYIDASGFEGDWYSLMNHLQSLVQTVATPIQEAKGALENLASANFSVHLDETRYKGEFAAMIRAVNVTASSISNYVNEISDVLNKMANQNLDVNIEHEYIGDFERVKTSLELIIDTFNKLIDEIIRSSEQIMIGSNSIADSSNSLAQGASQQAAAVEELNVTIGGIATNANHNTELVSGATKLADEAKDSVNVVGKEMGEMFEAMKQINESSSNISAVLQAIDDIAFQTNILALNAAVEAARAGEHGKGFAIVADEVRNLASRSQTAVKDTATMIETAIAKAEQGSAIVDRTASTINRVIEQIENLSKISEEVAVSSKQQNKSIGEINIGIQQISEVVSANTATSEESAAASEELASQADVFTKMVSRFKLKRKSGRP